MMIAFWIPIIAILNIDHIDTHLNLKKKKKTHARVNHLHFTDVEIV